MELMMETRGNQMSPSLSMLQSKPDSSSFPGHRQNHYDHHDQQHQAQVDNDCIIMDESQLIKEELSCKLQLKMMKEGKDWTSRDFDEQRRVDQPISEATRRMQQQRRERNKVAAKKCRENKKVKDELLKQKQRQHELEKSQLQEMLRLELDGLRQQLQRLPSQSCFKEFLRCNRHLLKNKHFRPVVLQFSECGYHQLPRTACNAIQP